MYKKIKTYLRCLLKCNIKESGAVNINNHAFINAIVSEPDYPWFISFPRTGSHWLRMIMELYFEKPSLVEIYYFKNAKEFICYHQHDLNLTVGGCTNVLYLYRDPVDTIYSNMVYFEENLDTKERVTYWTILYAKHLSKWLYKEMFTTKKTIVSYEELTEDLPKAFKKICKHFHSEFDQEKLEKALKNVTKKKLKEKTVHDNKVVNISSSYKEERENFRKKYASYIYESMNSFDCSLNELFNK